MPTRSCEHKGRKFQLETDDDEKFISFRDSVTGKALETKPLIKLKILSYGIHGAAFSPGTILLVESNPTCRIYFCTADGCHEVLYPC
jgi:hypothetical protein